MTHSKTGFQLRARKSLAGTRLVQADGCSVLKCDRSANGFNVSHKLHLETFKIFNAVLEYLVSGEPKLSLSQQRPPTPTRYVCRCTPPSIQRGNLQRGPQAPTHRFASVQNFKREPLRVFGTAGSIFINVLAT